MLIFTAQDVKELGGTAKLADDIVKFLGDARSLKKSIQMYGETLKLMKTQALAASKIVSKSDEDLSVFFASIAQDDSQRINEIIETVEKKIICLERLDTKCKMLDQIYSSKLKLQRKVVDLQKRTDFEGVSRTSRELKSVNESFRELENEIIAKVECIKTLFNGDICSIEKLDFLRLQKRWLTSVTIPNDVEVNSNLLLTDEFIKFEMSLEARVVERRREQSPEKTNSATAIFSNINDSDTNEKEPLKKNRKSLAFVPVYNSLLPNFDKKLSIEVEETKSSVEKVVALYEYIPHHEDELELLEFDVILVSQRNPDGWFVGVNTRTQLQGLFPGNYTKPCEENNK